LAVTRIDREAVPGARGVYETIIILKSSIADEDVSKEIDKAKGVILQKYGEVVSVENMGRKKLAYEVRKERRGVYILIHFRGDRNTVADLQRVCRFNETIIKFMIVKIKEQDLNSLDEKTETPVVKEDSADL
jgi:small subunit ribosomal protein S6